MSKIFRRDVRDLVKEAEELGWVFVERCGSGHLKMRHRETKKACYLPSSPSDRRALKNCRSQLKRLAKMSR